MAMCRSRSFVGSPLVGSRGMAAIWMSLEKVVSRGLLGSPGKEAKALDYQSGNAAIFGPEFFL